MELKKHISYNKNSNLILFIKDSKQLDSKYLSDDEIKHINTKFEQKKERVVLNKLSHYIFIQLIKQEENLFKQLEWCRNCGYEIGKIANEYKIKDLTLIDYSEVKELQLSFAEGMLLGNYQFLKYFTKKDEKLNSLNKLGIISDNISDQELFELKTIIHGTLSCRDLVNEPVSYLTAEKFSEEIIKLMKSTNAKVEVFNKKKIESLKMGGLLAVNKGSIDPPTFNIIEWKPENAKNKRPYILVGKGVVYDTGGLNIKTENYMTDMKCDMAGGAAVAGTMYSIAKAELPIYVIGLIPATDNRPNGNAYASGDVITMFDGSTVEVINTDAEGRMILADALAYAKKYRPKLVIDLATLTGSAFRAIGHHGSVAMQSKANDQIELLKKSGDIVHERIAEFPFWDDYNKEIKSTIADIKNLGGNTAGAITAGKFLAHFTDYPYIHIDIAGPAFLTKADSYRTNGATGTSVRLLYHFLKSKLIN